jgi:hypothetical protein
MLWLTAIAVDTSTASATTNTTPAAVGLNLVELALEQHYAKTPEEKA